MKNDEITNIRFSTTKVTILIGFTFVMLSLAHHLSSSWPTPQIKISKQEREQTPNHNFLKFVSAGNSRLISSYLWIKTLLESDVEHYEGELYKNWMFRRFYTISHLDPYFYNNYYYGGMYLGIIKNDPEAAAVLYERGLEYFPEDAWLNYNAGFGYYFDLSDSKRAVDKFEKVIGTKEQIKYMPSLPSLVAKIKAEAGDLKLAYELLLQAYQQTSKGIIRDRFHYNLYSLKAEIDLNCLNLEKVGCGQIDFDGKPYLQDRSGKFFAQSEWTKIRPNKKGSKSSP